MKVLVALAACLALAYSSPIETKADSVELTLFYESYCPYSIQFVNEQLYPVWQKFKEQMKVFMVPYGNAEQTYHNGKFVFTCQHGPEECLGNLLHTCAINEACGNVTTDCAVKDLTKAMGYINCVMSQDDQHKASSGCAKKSGLTENTIETCRKSKLGNTMESWYGNATAAFKHPKVNYVPFIVINGKHTEKLQNQAQDNLKKLICKYIQCK